MCNSVNWAANGLGLGQVWVRNWIRFGKWNWMILGWFWVRFSIGFEMDFAVPQRTNLLKFPNKSLPKLGVYTSQGFYGHYWSLISLYLENNL